MKAALIALLLLFPVSGAAGITIDEAVETALAHSEAAHIVRATNQALKSTGDQATAFAKPQLSVNAGYMEMGDNRPEMPLPAMNTPERDIFAELTATQLLYAGGRISRSLDLRRSIRHQADLGERGGHREIAANVRDAFNTVLYQQASLDISVNRLNQRLDELRDVQDLREVGMATALDERQAQLHVSFARDHKMAMETALLEATTAFNLSMGRSGVQPLLIPEGRLDNFPDTTPVMSALEQQFDQRQLLDLALKGEQTHAARTELQMVQGEHLPSLSAVVATASNGEKINDMHASWRVGLNLRWQLYSGGEVQAKVAQSRARFQSAAQSLEQVRKQIEGDIEVIRLNLDSLSRRIAMQHEAVRLSGDNYLDARGQYRAGILTLTQLGDFNLAAAEAEFMLIGLYFARHRTLTRALALLGK